MLISNPGDTCGCGPQFHCEAHLVSDVGCHRKLNEDCARYVNPDSYEKESGRGFLAVIADGMGGHAGGEVASECAVEMVISQYYDSHLEPHSALSQAFQKANQEIRRRASRERGLSGMGTTCTALALLNGEAFCAHVGDCRLYLVRDGELFQMTADHSEVARLVRQGLLSADEARVHEERNVLLRAMGVQEQLAVDTWSRPFSVKNRDRFMLCSDGLHDGLTEDDLRDNIVDVPPRDACRRLVKIAKDRGGFDNITLLLVAVRTPRLKTPSLPETRERKAVS